MNKAAAPRRSASVVLALLLIAYIFNFLDRQILAILAGPIIQRFEANRYAVRSPERPALRDFLFVARPSIRLPRGPNQPQQSDWRRGCTMEWFTACAGAAGSFLHLFVFRMGVGSARPEASPPSYALIADYFSAAAAGAGAGHLLTRDSAREHRRHIDWRLSRFMDQLARGASSQWGSRAWSCAHHADLCPRSPGARPSAAARVPLLRSLGSRAQAVVLAAGIFRVVQLACGLRPAAVDSIGVRAQLWPGIIERAQFLGSLLLIGGCAGVFAGGLLADRLGQRDRGWYAKLPAIAWLITAPTFALGLMAPSLWLAWPLLLIPNALNILWLGPVTAAVQHLVERPMRATASASFLLINNLIGLGHWPAAYRPRLRCPEEKLWRWRHCGTPRSARPPFISSRRR